MTTNPTSESVLSSFVVQLCPYIVSFLVNFSWSPNQLYLNFFGLFQTHSNQAKSASEINHINKQSRK
ncbi:hypothetical protein VNO77_16576 [Canavalia gladiata]|uniref:Uncharacterized protein n=1 Tax=Canavalia gladiata TaxID=3824 RepID=A0AAN9QLU2_CANGL